jgi:hypothetical protein
MFHGMLVHKQQEEPHLRHVTWTDVVVAGLAVPGLLLLALLIGLLLNAL